MPPATNLSARYAYRALAEHAMCFRMFSEDAHPAYSLGLNPLGSSVISFMRLR